MADEKEKTEEEKPQEEEQPKEAVQDFSAMVDRMEKANQKAEKLIQRQEALAARKLLGGVTEGTEEVRKKEETPSEYVKRLEQGKL